MQKARVFVPATIGNVGPGFDVLGLAVAGIGDTVELELIDGPSCMVGVRGRDAELVPKDTSNVAIVAAQSMLRLLSVDKGVSVGLERQLPIAGGLGSSAAASVGGAMAAAVASGQPYTDEHILMAALEGEASVAGRHLDNIAPAFYGNFTLVQSVDPIRVSSLHVPLDLHVVLVTPSVKIATKDARERLPSSLTTQNWTQQLAYATGLVAGMLTGDRNLIRYSLKDVFAEPARACLIPHFDAVKGAALEQGALGVSISGAGPTMFALCDKDEVAERCGAAMVKAFDDTEASLHIGTVARKGARIV